MDTDQLTKLTEWDAMKLLHQTLEQLEPEERGRVLNWTIDKYGITRKPLTNRNQQAGYKSVEGGSLGADNSEGEEGEIDIKSFISEKNPQGEVQRAVCLGFYLEKFRKQKDYINKEIEEANAEAKQFKFSNVTVPLKNAVRSGYMLIVANKEAGRSTARQLTSVGERVVEALPDQKAVTEVIKNFGKKRRVVRKIQSNDKK
jgi:hypothetical protein